MTRRNFEHIVFNCKESVLFLQRTPMKRIPLVLLFILSIFQGSAQNFPKPEITAEFSKAKASVGDVIEILVKVRFREDLHLYSEKTDCPEDDGPRRATLELQPNPGFELLGKMYSLNDKMVFEEVFNCRTGEFHGFGLFRQKIRILAPFSTAAGTFTGQICSESACDNIRPKDGGFTAKGITVSGEKIAPIEKPAVIDTPKTPDAIDTGKAEARIYKNDRHYAKKDANDTAACVLKTFNGQRSDEAMASLWGIFILAFISGLAALLTPCVFPMIPMTVTFFMKNKKRSIALREALIYAFSILGIYTLIGTLVAIIFGATAANWLSTHWLPNSFFFVIFLVFAASFFGAFEIVLPGWVVNKVDQQADKGGVLGPVFMALTIVLVSFSCTGPIVGTVLVNAADGSFIRPVVGMFGFALAFALPFGLLAVFPNWLNNLPKSGGWLNMVKVCLGFLELAFAFKFLSIIDQTYHWRLLDREIYLAIWIVIFSLMGIYLMGKIRFPHDSETHSLGIFRLSMIITTFTFVVYMFPGMWGAPLKALAGYLPPMSTQDFDINRQIREASGLTGNVCEKPRYSDKLHIPHGLNGYFDYEDALRCARELKKPVFIDFTGHGCVNCRKMEEKVWSDPQVLESLRNDFVIVSLYVDDKKIKLPPSEQFIGRSSGQKITMLADKNAEIELCYFGKTSQPLYCIIDGDENLLQPASSAEKFNFRAEPFHEFLKKGVAEFKKRNPK